MIDTNFNYEPSIEFLNKECKKENHKNCCRQWRGFGIKVTCICDCHVRKHKNMVLERPDESSNTILLEDTTSK